MTRTMIRELGRWVGNLVLGLMAGAGVVQLAKAVLVLSQMAHG